MCKKVLNKKVEELKEKEFRSQRVVTFKDIDAVHGRVEGTAKRNFNENKNRLIENEDYFFVKPKDIEKYEIRTSEINNAGTYLITESGYLMLVKSFTDSLAWKVQKKLVNSYFRVKEIKNQYQGLSKELQAIFVLDNKQQKLEKDIKDLKDNMPLFNIDCDELQAQVRKIGVNCLEGKNSLAYKNRSLRGKVYADIQRELKRQFGVRKYKAIKRSQLEIAKNILKNYKLPLQLEDSIKCENNQMELVINKMRGIN